MNRPTPPFKRAGRPPVFLERRTYRQQRLSDALRLLPVFGAILVLLPGFWPGTALSSTADVLRFVFAAWALVIVLGLVLARAEARLSRLDATDDLDDRPEGP